MFTGLILSNSTVTAFRSLCQICLQAEVAELIGSSATWFRTLIRSGHKYIYILFLSPKPGDNSTKVAMCNMLLLRKGSFIKS